MELQLERDIRQVLTSVAETFTATTGEEQEACKSSLIAACERLRHHRLSPGDKREVLAKYAEFALKGVRPAKYGDILKLLSLITTWPEHEVHREIQERVKSDRSLKAAFRACPKEDKWR
mgnify:CR=1 FL=1